MTSTSIHKLTDSFYNNDINLTEEQVHDLLQEFSSDTRSEVARRVAGIYQLGDLQEEDFQLAEQIFNIMIDDASVKVRQSLSESLQDSDIVSHDIIFALAHDEEVVAKPVISSSKLLTDEDLIQIIQTGKTYLQKLVAARNSISEPVSDAVVETNKEEVVEELAANISANISEESLSKILDQFADSETLLQKLVDSHELPPAIVEKAVAVASSSIAAHIVDKYEIETDKAHAIERETRERTTLDIIKNPKNKEEITKLIEELEVNFKLTHSIIFTALCKGNLVFFEAALARLASVSTNNAHMLLSDATGRGFRALYTKAGLPSHTQYATKLVFNAVVTLVKKGISLQSDSYKKEMLAELDKNKDVENMHSMIDLVKS